MMDGQPKLFDQGIRNWLALFVCVKVMGGVCTDVSMW